MKRLCVFGSYVRPNVKLKPSVSELPVVDESPAPSEPVSGGGGGSGHGHGHAQGGGGGGASVWARAGSAAAAARHRHRRRGLRGRGGLAGERPPGEKVAEFVSQGSRVVAVAPVPGERLRDDALEPGVRARQEAREERRVVVDPQGEVFDPAGPEGEPAGEELEERRPERVDVGAAVERGAGQLLWRDVGRRADEEAGLRPHLAVGALGDPEVHELRTPVRCEEDVVGLDVAVEDPPGVAVRQRVRERLAEPGGFLGGVRAVAAVR